MYWDEKRCSEKGPKVAQIILIEIPKAGKKGK